MTDIDFFGKPDCSQRQRFSKRQRPLSARVDWCPWCRRVLKGTDGCPVEAARLHMVKAIEGGERG